jgi:hypothetical protein
LVHALTLMHSPILPGGRWTDRQGQDQPNRQGQDFGSPSHMLLSLFMVAHRVTLSGITPACLLSILRH